MLFVPAGLSNRERRTDRDAEPTGPQWLLPFALNTIRTYQQSLIECLAIAWPERDVVSCKQYVQVCNEEQ